MNFFRRRVRDLATRGFFTALAFAFATALAGCAQLEHQGDLFAPVPTPPPKPAPPRPENRGGVQHKELVAQFGGEYRDPAAETYLNAVLAKLAVADGVSQAYRVTILNTPVVNAFALPSGNIYVTRGLLALANDGAEVAAVMAHEIFHVTARHSALRAEREREAAVISQAASVIQSRQKGEEIRSNQSLSVASFSRLQELDADAAGIQAVSRAGYDPYGASRFLTALGRSSELRAAISGKKKSSIDFDILATHPSTPERIAKAVAAARQIGAPGIGVTDRESYLAAINGIAFGDDPAEGFVRGRRFSHPRLRFTFTAPEDFILENSNESVFGVLQSENEALRLDSVRAPAQQTLEAYLQSGWVDGLLPSSIKSTEINGLPAVTASARAGEWNFRIAVLRLGDELYRLIFAARALNDAVEARFAASINSFRRMNAEEARDFHGLKIVVATAGPGDAPASFSARMMTPNRPEEYFRLINGLDPNAGLTAGEKYKLVIE